MYLHCLLDLTLQRPIDNLFYVCSAFKKNKHQEDQFEWKKKDIIQYPP